MPRKTNLSPPPPPNKTAISEGWINAEEHKPKSNTKVPVITLSNPHNPELGWYYDYASYSRDTERWKGVNGLHVHAWYNGMTEYKPDWDN